MKLAYVVRHIDSAGGRERVLTNKANYFARVGYRVAIVTMFQGDDRTIFDLDERVQIRHLKLLTRERFRGSRLAYWRYIKQALERILVELSPDIAVSMWWGIEFRVLPFVKDGSRKLLEFHFSHDIRERIRGPRRYRLLRRIRARFTNWIEDRIVNRYDRLVVLTNEDRSRWNAKRVVVIPNALSFVADTQSDCFDRVVIAAGRLSEEKGIDRLIPIWAAIEDEYPDWSLRIFGNGPEKEHLARLIETNGLKNVALLPATPHIQAEMLRASILVSTSRYEGFGMAILEAMQCGLPVIAYRAKGGPGEIIDQDTTGFLVDDGDADAFVDRLRRLITDRDLRLSMGRAGKRLSYEKFREDVVMEMWKQLFEETVNAG